MSKKLNSIFLVILVLTLILATSGCAKAAGLTYAKAAGLTYAKADMALSGIPQFQQPVSGAGISVGPCDPVTDVCGDHKGPDTYAIDYIGPAGTPIKPTLAGVVVFSGSVSDGYGDVVAIRHSDDQNWNTNYYSIYAHLTGDGLPKVGDSVVTSTIIGYMGNTGTTIVHLHFAVRSSDQVYDGAKALYGQNLNPYELYTPAFNVRTLFGLNP